MGISKKEEGHRMVWSVWVFAAFRQSHRWLQPCHGGSTSRPIQTLGQYLIELLHEPGRRLSSSGAMPSRQA